jgi:hypothetical protein
MASFLNSKTLITKTHYLYIVSQHVHNIKNKKQVILAEKLQVIVILGAEKCLMAELCKKIC